MEPVLIELIAASPIAGAMIAVVILFLKYLKAGEERRAESEKTRLTSEETRHEKYFKAIEAINEKAKEEEQKRIEAMQALEGRSTQAIERNTDVLSRVLEHMRGIDKE